MTHSKFNRRTFLHTSIAASGAVPLGLPGWAQDGPTPVEGGIGGTGIVGILTDFGSLIVAGQLVETTARTQISDIFGPRPLESLALGHSLTIEAALSPEGLIARRVHVTYPVIGRIDAVRADGLALKINGIDVHLASPSPLAETGVRVAVSGLWEDQHLRASLLEPAPSDIDVIAGTVHGALGDPHIGPIPVHGAQTEGLVPGGYGAATGHYDHSHGNMTTHAVDKAHFTGSAGPLETLVIEGYVAPDGSSAGAHIAGFGHSFTPGPDFRSHEGTRTLFVGTYMEAFAVNEMIALPDDAQERRRLLHDHAIQ